MASYFLTKGVAAGAMMLAVLLLVIGAQGSALADIVPGVLALAGIAMTGMFLIWDLKQPRRFYYLFTRPQWRSWLAIGTQFINASALIVLAFTVAAVFRLHGLRDAPRWAMVPAGVLLAGYRALLFKQCEGRDLCQSPWLLAHTIVNALIVGAASLGVVALFVDAPATSSAASSSDSSCPRSSPWHSWLSEGPLCFGWRPAGTGRLVVLRGRLGS